MSIQEESSGYTAFENHVSNHDADKGENYHPYGLTDNDDSGPRNPSQESLCKIYTGGANNEYIYIGRQKFLREQLTEAFGGTLNPGLAPTSVHRFANPAPLGLSAFALTTFVLSMFNSKAQGITTPNVVVGLAMFYGGVVQIIAGIWEVALENTFGATALCSYGGFWLSFGSIYIPWFGILDAYTDKESELGNALGFYLLGWCIFTFGLSVCTMKSTVMFFALFFLLGVTFLLLSIGEFSGESRVTRAGGILGVIVAFIAWYNAYAGLANKQNSYILAHPFPLPDNEKVLHI
ncbi:acetate uptake transporter family protein NDAI_0D01210 [Naumovozyma dairenensis CBS 421]|uniref:Uncharacterized protein n=1 Tax=Naumovozyma dairenensis (strain ATCC 10597 / BCRC 20456 / CBS 421 / NBRC 0211 / NRRL Y-12639) TaxID=1071378 RepID=G0W9H3_NAUDC|nr:hypothetical protein NDAI_0D01210 [Naumovozyma dairenensis CBS 421]CCD24434.1 hypothetical protein NDAI_0D01210 [Naumovozyma dairenensis CBS 421]